MWVTKLFGYDITVEYRSGKLNTVADVLSHRDEDSPVVQAIFVPIFSMYDALQAKL